MLYIPKRGVYSARHCGGVAERLKAAVLKTADGKPSESSNLSSSATLSATGNKAVKINSFADAVQFQNGGVAERLKAAVLKTADGKPSESSNLSSSATFYRPARSAGLFRFCSLCNFFLSEKSVPLSVTRGCAFISPVHLCYSPLTVFANIWRFSEAS